MPMQCSAPGWVSGGTTGHGIDGYRFEPFRVREGQPWPRRHQNGDAHGRLFVSVDEGSRFSLERGYSVLPRSLRSSAARCTGVSSGGCIRLSFFKLRLVESRAALIALSDQYSRYVGAVFGSGLRGDQFGAASARTHWSVGYWAAARKLRPDLFQPAERFAWSPAKREGR